MDLGCIKEGLATGAQSGEGVHMEPDKRHQRGERKGSDSSEVEIAAVAGKTNEVGLAIVNGGTQRLWPVIGIGAGLTVVAAGIGAGLTITAKDAQLEVELKRPSLHAPCPKQPTAGTCKEIADAASRHDAMAGGAIGLFVAAGVFGAATVAYGIWPQVIPFRPAVAAGPSGAAASISGTF